MPFRFQTALASVLLHLRVKYHTVSVTVSHSVTQYQSHSITQCFQQPNCFNSLSGGCSPIGSKLNLIADIKQII